MNYYQFHLGDYSVSTRGLSWDEHCAYRMLIDLYYAREEPISLDRQRVYRQTMARSKRQKAAIDQILADFFIETPEGWVNERCERDLAAYRLKGERAQQAGMASAAARRARAQQVDEAATEDLLDAGEPVTNGRATDAGELLNGRSSGVQQMSSGRSTTVQPTNNQEPITNNQEPSLTPLAPSPLPDSTPEAGSAVDNSDSIEVREPPPKAAAAAPPAGSAPPVVLIPLQGKDLFGVDQAQIDAWRESYPAVDVLQTLRHIREWCLSNPARKKTRKGVRSFVTSWLAREQDAGGARRGMAGVRAPDGPVGRENGDSREAMLARLEASRFCTVNQLNYNEGVGNDGRISL